MRIDPRLRRRVFQRPDFIASLQRFIDPLILPGRINSLAQTLIKMVVPGVPDFYQGTELWDLSPGRPGQSASVDFECAPHSRAARARYPLPTWRAEWDSRVAQAVDDGSRAGDSPRTRGRFSDQSKYQPLIAQGTHLARLFAFRRGENLIAVCRGSSCRWAANGEIRGCRFRRRVAQLLYRRRASAEAYPTHSSIRFRWPVDSVWA